MDDMNGMDSEQMANTDGWDSIKWEKSKKI